MTAAVRATVITVFFFMKFLTDAKKEVIFVFLPLMPYFFCEKSQFMSPSVLYAGIHES